LHLPAAERDQVLAEVRGHLEERAQVLHETGVSEEHAEQQAVADLLFLGPPRLSAAARSAAALVLGGWRYARLSLLHACLEVVKSAQAHIAGEFSLE
jgi:hypothetical protein